MKKSDAIRFQIKNLSKLQNRYQEEIAEFLNSLDTELTFMARDLNAEKVQQSDYVFAAFSSGQKIIGLTGLQCRYGIGKSYTVIHKDFQRQGLGGEFKKLNATMLENVNLLLEICEPLNFHAINFQYKNGYRLLGKRWGLMYFSKPLNFKGKTTAIILKIILHLLELFPKKFNLFN